MGAGGAGRARCLLFKQRRNEHLTGLPWPPPSRKPRNPGVTFATASASLSSAEKNVQIVGCLCTTIKLNCIQLQTDDHTGYLPATMLLSGVQHAPGQHVVPSSSKATQRLRMLPVRRYLHHHDDPGKQRFPL